MDIFICVHSVANMAVTCWSLIINLTVLLMTLIPVITSAGNDHTQATEDTLILVSDWGTPGRMLNVSLKHMKFTAVPSNVTERPVAIDYDPRRNTVYWTDVLLHQIRSLDIRTGRDSVLAQLDNTSTPDGLAVDTEEGTAFYTDAGKNLVVKLNLIHLHSETVIGKDLLEPRGIVTYRVKRKIYWTDWGENPKIETASYEGQERRTLVTTGLKWPNGLTMDKHNARLYWCDAKLSVIESVDLEGGDRRVVLSEPIAHYFDIFYHQGILYFTDWRRRRSLLQVPACGGKVSSLHSNSFRHLAGLHVSSTRESETNPVVPECDYKCTHCKNKTDCDALTGTCTGGCMDGWIGATCNTLVKHATTAATPMISNKMTQITTTSKDADLGNEDNSNSTDVHMNADVTPAKTVERTKLDTNLSIGLAAYIGLGCVSFFLMIATITLLVVYINRRKKDKKRYNNLEESRQQSFSNNTYTLMSGDCEDRTQLYLVPFAESVKQLDDADHFYEDIDELKT